jgi:hypothetical protein
MASGIPARLLRALAQAGFRGISGIGRSLSGVALAGLALAGCASPGSVPSTLAGEQSAPPKAGPAQAQAATAGSRSASLTMPAVDPVLEQRRRQAIAALLESSIGYRTILDVKLTDAKLAGPYLETYRNLFSGSTSEDRYYCVSANLDLPYLPQPYPRTAVIRVKPAENGSESLRAAIGLTQPPSECMGKRIPYGPFPELEQLRAKRRQAQGKTD